jgi:hypothetical protein
MPGTHFSLRLTEEEIVALAAGAVEDLAHRLAQRVCGPAPGAEIAAGDATTGEAPDAGTALDPTAALDVTTAPAPVTALGAGADARTEALAHLHMLVHLQHAVALLEDRAAEEAAAAGAGYPQIGRACNISRQGARRRWPGLVTGQTGETGQPSQPGQATEARQATKVATTPHHSPRRNDRTRSR